jgi:hypothetical protein
MKTIILFTLTLLTLLPACNAKPINIEHTTQAQTRVLEIISFVIDQKTVELEKIISTAEESGVKRHAATAVKVKEIFAGIELSKVEFGPSSYDKVRGVIVVQIVAPIRIDLEFSIHPDNGRPAKLQALHP